ncbi:MAG: CotH kinase family protein [Anaerolineaceae bacterium]
MSLKLKRNIPLMILFAIVIGGLIFGIGNQRIIAYSVPGAIKSPDKEVINISNTVDLFDNSRVHRLEISMDEEEYETMLLVYQKTGEKQYFHASVTIDGVTVNDAGIRLKGNASLRTALGGGGRQQGGGPAAGMGQAADRNPGGGNLGGANPVGGNPDGGNINGRNLVAGNQGGEDTGNGNQGGENPGGANMGVGNRQSQIPMLIKFDEYITGQVYQGYDRLAIRSSGTRYDASMLQEPVTNSVFRLMGLPATETTYAGISLNGGEEILYTLSEVIAEGYLEEHFENGNGILYKGEVRANMSYQGEDPSSYADSFEQQTRKNDGDMAPLIDFIKFITDADDETFETELPDRLDVDAFATYLAINCLLVNNDSMAGMGNNYYLYYDDEGGRFTVLMWDANESLGSMGGGIGAPGAAGGLMQGPGGGALPGVGMQAGPQAGGQASPGGQFFRPGAAPNAAVPNGQMRANNARPGMAFENTATNRDSARADIYPAVRSQGGGNRMGGGSNLLLMRFMSMPAFKALYEEKVIEVYEKAFASGTMIAKIEEITAVVHEENAERGFVDAEAYEQAAARVVDLVKRRGEYIGGTELVKGGT